MKMSKFSSTESPMYEPLLRKCRGMRVTCSWEGTSNFYSVSSSIRMFWKCSRYAFKVHQNMIMFPNLCVFSIVVNDGKPVRYTMSFLLNCWKSPFAKEMPPVLRHTISHSDVAFIIHVSSHMMYHSLQVYHWCRINTLHYASWLSNSILSWGGN